jgi:hypothetical protein
MCASGGGLRRKYPLSTTSYGKKRKFDWNVTDNPTYKRDGPSAKGTALRITVLGNGRGILGWLAVEKKPGNYSIKSSVQNK